MKPTDSSEPIDWRECLRSLPSGNRACNASLPLAAPGYSVSDCLRAPTGDGYQSHRRLASCSQTPVCSGCTLGRRNNLEKHEQERHGNAISKEAHDDVTFPTLGYGAGGLRGG